VIELEVKMLRTQKTKSDGGKLETRWSTRGGLPAIRAVHSSASSDMHDAVARSQI
jgi:hypothetical protein